MRASEGKRRHVTVRRRLALLVVACVLPVWIAAGFLLYYNFRSRRALTEQRMLETARALTMVVDREIATMQASLNALATTPSLVNADLPAFYRQARVVREAYPGSDILLADPTGQELINTFLPFGTPLPKRGVPEAAHQVYATGRPLITDVFRGPMSGRLLISVDVPVLRDGRVVYDLAMFVPADQFARILLQQHLPPEWIGGMYDSNQVMVARTRLSEEFVGRHPLPELGLPMRKTAEGTVEGTNFEGIRIFNSFSRSATSGWTVVVGVPKAIIREEAWRWLWWTIAGVALLSFVGIWLALLMARRIASSIQGLIAPALALGCGESVAIGPLDLAETQDVGESLVKASELIQQRTTLIQQRAAEHERAEAVRREAEELRRLNEELERSEAEVRARATELAVVMDAVPALVLIAHDPECQRMTGNRTGYDLLRVLPGDNLSKSAPEDERLSNYHLVRDGRELSSAELPVQLAAATGREIRDYEYRIVFDDGSSREMIGNAVPLLDKRGKVQGAVGAFLDITERQRAEEALRESEAGLAAAQRIAHIGSWQWDIQSDTVRWSDEHFRIFNLTPTQLQKHRQMLDLVHPADQQRVDEARRDALSGTREYDIEFRVCLSDGSEKVIHSQAEVLRDPHGKPVAMRGIVHDITERKRAEQALRESERFLRTVIDLVPHLIFVKDPESRYLLVNRACAEAYGTTPAQMVGRRTPDLVSDPSHAEAFMKADREVINSGAVKFIPEEEIRHANGTTRLHQTTKVPFVNSVTGAPALIGVSVDITDYKRTQQALTEGEERLRTILELAPDGIFVVSEQGQILEANEAGCQQLGYTRDQLLQLKISDIIAPRFAQRAAARLRGEVPSGSYENAHIRADGSEVPTELSVTKIIYRGRPAFLRLTRDITERKRAEAHLKATMERLRAIVQNAPVGVNLLDREGHIQEANPALCRILGYSTEELKGRKFTEYTHPDDLPKSRFQRWDPQPYELEKRYIRKDGGVVWVQVIACPMSDSLMVGIVEDISERKRSEEQREELEQQLRQAQKMEAVGRLAGGIAHDFNNLLMVIQGYTTLLQRSLPAGTNLQRNTQEIMKAAERAASLTRQMLAFSRKQILSPVVLDLNAVVDETAKILKRLIGEDVEFRVNPAKSLWAIEADSDQIVQVLMNLCVNARDAMPQGGTLTITTGNVSVEEGGTEARPYVLPGDYVSLSVIDTGTGISKDMQEQIFEPFFTTKEVGKGTGLGLAMVYGIVKQSSGYVWVDSELGQGACFTIYLPRVERAVALDVSAEANALPLGTETLLVAEDEESLREVICGHLRSLGYTVLEAGSGHQAVAVASQYAGHVDLLITDLVMPKMSGRELSEMLGGLRPDLKTIYISGYTDDVVLRHGISELGITFLQKPFSLGTLARKVRDTLGRTETVQ
jgi:PAS domain S-box-containing protein